MFLLLTPRQVLVLQVLWHQGRVASLGNKYKYISIFLPIYLNSFKRGVSTHLQALFFSNSFLITLSSLLLVSSGTVYLNLYCKYTSPNHGHSVSPHYLTFTIDLFCYTLFSYTRFTISYLKTLRPNTFRISEWEKKEEKNDRKLSRADDTMEKIFSLWNFV